MSIEKEEVCAVASGAASSLDSFATSPVAPATRGMVLWHHPLVAGLLVTFVYYGMARLGILLAFKHTNASPVWVASGLALVVVLWRGRGMAPFIALGALAANYVTFVDYGVPETRAAFIAAAMAAGNAIEALLGARWLGDIHRAEEMLDHPKEVFRFAALAGAASCAVAATVATFSLCVGGLATWGQFGYVWSTWWMGDVAGVLLIAPLLLAWQRPIRLPGELYLEALSLLLVVLGVGGMVFGSVVRFGTAYPLAYLAMPPLIWAVFRFKQHGATMALLLTTGLAVWGTTRGSGPFWVEDDVHQSLLLLQTFMGVLTMTVLLSLSALAERARVQESLQQARDELEWRVEERTAALRESNLRLEESYDELQAVQELREGLLHMVVHDLRTPLNALDYMLNMLSGKSGLDSSAQQAVQLSLQSSRTLSGLINNLLDLHLEEAGALRLRSEPLQAGALMEASAAQIAWLAAYKKVNLGCEVEPGLLPFQGDADKLTRTLVNLLDNALRHTPAGGDITLAVRSHDGEALHFSVTDTGTGIPIEAQTRIFDKFGRVAPDDAGARATTGLGLAFCNMIVAAHGGQIGVQSTVNQGSTFFFTIPLCPLASAPENSM